MHDPFVGIMKGVILGIAPGAQIVDISHDIQSYDMLEGAFVVESAYRYFPKGTVHVVVVDPGVGSARRPMPLPHTANCSSVRIMASYLLSWTVRSTTSRTAVFFSVR